MLTSKLNDILANRTKLLAAAIAVLVVVGALAAQTGILSSQLAEKSKTIELQNREIQQYVATISSQRQEVEDKATQLAQLNAQIDARSQQVDSLGAELSAQGAKLAELQAQAERLQAEIGLLQSKIRSDEEYLAYLTKQLEITQESAKRVRISHYGLAIAEGGRGVVFPIEVEIISSGTGAISVDVSNVQYEAAFQTAVRTAATVASEYTGEPISDKDIIVRLVDDHPDDSLVRIDGPSAGALITGMIVAGLTDRAINDKVLVTGIIKPDGTVGTVGSVEGKTEAALDFGAVILVVPESQEFESGRIVVVGVSDIDEVVKYLVVS